MEGKIERKKGQKEIVRKKGKTERVSWGEDK